MKEKTILLHTLFVLIVILSFLSNYLGWFSLVPISLTIFFIPGYILFDLLNYKVDKIFKKIVYSFSLSISITIIVATFVTLITKSVKYQIIIIIISSITLLMEIALQILLIRNKFYKDFNIDLTSFRKVLKVEISKKSMKKNILYGLTTILIITGLCFPLFFKKESESYIFAFSEVPPSNITNTSFEFRISAKHVSKDSIFLKMKIIVNGTIYLEDYANSTVSGELELKYTVNFPVYALYHVIFNFFLDNIESDSEEVGYLFHWLKIIP